MSMGRWLFAVFLVLIIAVSGRAAASDLPTSNPPAPPASSARVISLWGGARESIALKSDGTVWAWGGNFVGQLGNGTYTNTTTPVQVNGLNAVTALGGRGYHNLAVESDGSVWAWGWNSRGQLGHDTSASPCLAPLAGTCSNVPVQVIGISHPLTVTGGGFFSLALLPDHTLRAWGANEYGQLGDGSIIGEGQELE